MQVAPINNNISRTSFCHGSHNEDGSNLKTKVFLTSLGAVGLATGMIAKKQGFSLNAKNMFKTNPKDWAIFKYHNTKKPNENFIHYETGEILAMGSASVAGGFLGGAAFDEKRNLKAKARESLNQLVGNVLIPICCVGTAGKYYASKHYDKFNGKRFKVVVEQAMPQLKGKTTTVKYANMFIKAVPTVAVTAVALGTGILIGNKVSNYINEQIYRKKIDRDVKVSDLAPHVDDVCYAAGLMAPKTPLFSAISRIVPLALTVPGVEVGTAKDDGPVFIA